MRKVLIALALLLVAGSAQAQELKNANFMYKYDLDATALTYCRVEGRRSDPYGTSDEGQTPINISSASAAATATTAGTNPFFGLAVNDILVVNYKDGTSDQKVIVTFTDNDNVTVDSNWTSTVTAQSFRYFKTKCGTTDNDGWIDVTAYAYKAITFELEQYNVTGGIDVRWECKDSDMGAKPIQVFPACPVGVCNTVQNYSGTVGIASRTKLVINEPWSSCRIGVAIHTSDDGGDTGANAEQITAILSVQIQK